MAIVRRTRKSGTKYQVKLKGTDGFWITETFDRLSDAEKWEAELKLKKLNGHIVSNMNRDLTVSEYFEVWHKESGTTHTSAGWKASQFQMFRDHINPIIGSKKLQALKPVDVARVLADVNARGFSKQMQVHVYALMRKVFGDAVQLFQVIERSPVLKNMRPRLPIKEAAYLPVEEIRRLLTFAKGKPYELAIWLGVVAGRRVGEIQALCWKNVDLEKGLIHVRSTYVRREKRFSDYPKGKKWHTVKCPPELLELLIKAKQNSISDYVVTSESGCFLSYHTYQKALRRYCRLAGVRRVSSHGLRHSTSELYMANGASRDDLRILFSHASGATTDRYCHDRGQRLEKVADVIRLFEKPDLQSLVSPKLPQRQMEVEESEVKNA